MFVTSEDITRLCRDACTEAINNSPLIQGIQEGLNNVANDVTILKQRLAPGQEILIHKAEDYHPLDHPIKLILQSRRVRGLDDTFKQHFGERTLRQFLGLSFVDVKSHMPFARARVGSILILANSLLKENGITDFDIKETNFYKTALAAKVIELKDTFEN